MDKNLSLTEIKSIAFQMLLYLREFCQKYGIRFMLSNGTLLGAVKYAGFIPWDDDIDVFVPRKDYDRLINLFQDNDRYRLFSIEREPNYKYTFAKLCDMTTIKEEFNIDNGVPLGIDIDIFPLDSCTDHIFLYNVQKKVSVFQKGCVLAKFKSSKGRPIYKRLVIDYCRKRGFNYFYKGLTSVIKKETNLGDNYKGCLMWPIYGKREILPAEVFSDIVEVEFEGEKFPAPIGYDIYLRSLYGDYKKDLPLDKQKTHHNFKAYRV